jgi:hypothetical protein
MDRSRINKQINLWFFLLSGLAMAYFISYLTKLDPQQVEAHPKAEQASYQIVPASPDRVILTKGIPRTIDNVKLTYQGMDDNDVVIDVTILSLDPQYAYRRTISKQIAMLGFSMAQQQYRLISAGSSRLKIARTKG